MKKLLLVFALVLTVFALSAAAEQITGFIGDSKCAAKHASDGNSKCAQSCVKGGAAPVLVSEGKVLKIDDASKVTDHVGHKVIVTGKVDGDTITVDSVKMAE